LAVRLQDVPRGWWLSLDRESQGWFNEVVSKVNDILAGKIINTALSSDPADPAANSSVVWQSDGTGSGDDGDIMIKVTDSNGTTKTGTLVDFSAI